MFTLVVNRQSCKVDVHPEIPLLWVLRDYLSLGGTKYGCGIGQCGACTVLIDGKAQRSCLIAVQNLNNSNITTIEGIGIDTLHPIQEAWLEEDVPQCGYCQSGQIMQALSLLQENPNPTDQEIDQAMQGNICRCGTYQRIKKAIRLAAQNLNTSYES